MVSSSPRSRTGPKTPAGLARCRTSRLTHGYWSARAYEWRRAWRKFRRAQVAVDEALRAGADDADNLVAAIGPKILALAGVLGVDLDQGTPQVETQGRPARSEQTN